MIRPVRALLVLATMLMLMLASNVVRAQTPQLQPPLNLGFTSFFDGIPPAGPGLYFQEYVQYYESSRINGSNGHALSLPNPSVNFVASLNQLLYIAKGDLPLIDAKPGLDIIVPVISTDMSTSPKIPGFSSNSGFGDMLIGPFLQFNPIMKDGHPLFIHRVEAQMLVPVGEYNRNDLLNPSSNFFSFNPYWAATYFAGPKYSISWRAHYLWNTVNHDPWIGDGPDARTSQAGQAVHFNFAIDRVLIEKKLFVGLNGYWLQQTTNSKLNGVNVPGSRQQVLAIGPGFLYSFSPSNNFFCNAFWETETRDQPQGFRLNLRWVYHF